MRELNLQEKEEASGGFLGTAAFFAFASASVVLATYQMAKAFSSPKGGRVVVTDTACVWVP